MVKVLLSSNLSKVLINNQCLDYRQREVIAAQKLRPFGNCILIIFLKREVFLGKMIMTD